MFQGGIGPVVAYRHTSHQSKNISHGIARTILQDLESEVGTDPHYRCFADHAQYQYRELAHVEMAGDGGFEPPHKVLETLMLPLTSIPY